MIILFLRLGFLLWGAATRFLTPYIGQSFLEMRQKSPDMSALQKPRKVT